MQFSQHENKFVIYKYIKYFKVYNEGCILYRLIFSSRDKVQQSIYIKVHFIPFTKSINSKLC